MSRKTLLGKITFVPISLAALFYLFVVPMITALNSSENSSILSSLFAAFLLLQVFALVFIFAIETAKELYGVNLKFVHRNFFKARFVLKKSESKKSKIRVIVITAISYLMFIYAFAVVYVYLSNLSPDNFVQDQPLDAFDGFYFSTVTATTVGFGDITPSSTIAKLICVLQIYSNLAYVIFVFSGFAAYFRDKE